MIDIVENLLSALQIDISTARISPLHGGITNRNFRVELPHQTLVVRLGGDGTSLLGINRDCEHRASHIAASAGVGATVVHSDPRQDVLVTRYLEGVALTPETAAQADTLRRVVEVLRRIHEGQAFPCSFNAFDFVRQSARISKEAAEFSGDGALPPGAVDALARMARIEAALGRLDTPRPCHNDLLPANFLDDGVQVRVIDWEYAGMGDPWFDLGNFAAHHELDEESSKLMLTLYLGYEPTAAEIDRLSVMRLVSDLREAFWGILQASVSSLDFDFREYAGRYLRRFHEGATDALLARVEGRS